MDLGNFRRVFATISAQNATKTARRPMKLAQKLCQDIPNMPGDPAAVRSHLHGRFGGRLLCTEILAGNEGI